VQHERGRRLVEQLRVVDRHDGAAPPRAVLQRGHAPAQQRAQVIGARRRRHEVGEGSERHARRAARGQDPLDERAPAFGGGRRLATDPRLAHSGAADEHDARPARGPRRLDALELLGAADEPGGGLAAGHSSRRSLRPSLCIAR
jgi:hypothetical protein